MPQSDRDDNSEKPHLFGALDSALVWSSLLGVIFMISLLLVSHPGTTYVDGFMAWEDANLYFNRANNLDQGLNIYRYSGYVSLGPQVLTYIYSFLPYLLQSFCYALTALLVGLWMFYQFAALLIDTGARRSLAIGAALVAAVILHCVCQELYLNLSFAIWSGLIAASIYAVRIALGDAKPDWFSTILAAVGFASHPLALASLPILAAGTYLRRARLAPFRLHALVLEFGILFVVIFAKSSRYVPSLACVLDTSQQSVHDLLSFGFRTKLIIQSSIFFIVLGILVGLLKLLGLARSGTMTTGKTTPGIVLSGCLYLIFAYLALFLASGRLRVDLSNEGRYFTPIVDFATLTLAISFIRAPWLEALGRRLESFGKAPAYGVMAVWLAACLVAGPIIFWHQYANRLRFLAAAQCLHDSGLRGLAIAAEDHEATLAIANGQYEPSKQYKDLVELKLFVEPLDAVQRTCPGISPSYVQAVKHAHIWNGPEVF